MYLIVRQSDNKIIGSAVKEIDEVDASKKGYVIYEIEDDEFTIDMLGNHIEEFDNWE